MSPHGSQYKRNADLPATAARAGRLTTVPAVGLPLDVVTPAIILVRALAGHEVLASLMGAAASMLLAHAEPTRAVGLVSAAAAVDARVPTACFTSSKEHLILTRQKICGPRQGVPIITA